MQANALLEEDLHDPAHKRLAHMVQQNADRLARIAEEVLDIARVQHQISHAPASTLPLDETVSQIWNDWQAQDPVQRRAVVMLEAGNPQVEFDTEHLRRVLVNLLDNAIQAMNQKGRVWLTTQYDTKRRRAVVSIADEGTGIAPEDQEKLFVPYFTRKKTGTGLGLAIVRRIITDHEGQISAGNNQPRGAVFTFELPV